MSNIFRNSVSCCSGDDAAAVAEEVDGDCGCDTKGILLLRLLLLLPLVTLPVVWLMNGDKVKTDDVDDSSFKSSSPYAMYDVR